MQTEINGLGGKIVKMARNTNLLRAVGKLTEMYKSCIKDMGNLIETGKELKKKAEDMQSKTDLPSAADIKEFTDERDSFNADLKSQSTYMLERLKRLPKATVVEG